MIGTDAGIDRNVGWALVGGFGAGSDIVWDLMAGASYQTGFKMRVCGGYHALGADYGNNGFVYDVTRHGPVIGDVIRS